MTTEEQLSLWVKGESHHISDQDGGTCCPDFSCCNPRLLAHQEEREMFAELFHKKDGSENGLLITFLGRALADLNSKREIFISDGITRKVVSHKNVGFEKGGMR